MEQVIVDIARRLGLEAERVWPQVVAVTFLKGLFYSVSEPLILVTCIWLIVVLVRIIARERARPKSTDGIGLDDGLGTYLCCGSAIAILAIVGFAVLSDLPNQFAAVLYPEAVTVINLAKSAKS